jgi:uncharacterized protein (DUF488 family)
VEIYTIGFTKRTAENFFSTLAAARIERVLDTRIRPNSQLAGFTRARDMEFFLDRLVGATYEPLPILAPEAELLAEYRKKTATWDEYATRYINLIDSRNVETSLPRISFERRSVLLCSEHEPDRCHRRLAAEYLAARWDEVSIIHL